MSQHRAPVLVPAASDDGAKRHSRNKTRETTEPAATPLELYLQSLAPGSRRTMRGTLEAVARFLAGDDATAAAYPWHELTYPQTAAVRAAWGERFAPSTVRKTVAALRGVLRQCWRLGLMSTDAHQRAVDVAPVRGYRMPAGRALAPAELAAVLRACEDGTARGARDAALIALLYLAGLRRREAARLELADLDLEAAAVRVLAKGNRERLVPLAPAAIEPLRRWLGVRGLEPGALFLATKRGGALLEHGIGESALYATLHRRAAAAGIEDFSPHDLRRTCAGDLLDAGEDLSTVQRVLGHSQLATTALYDRRGDRALRRAVGRLQLPNAGSAPDEPSGAEP